MIPKNREDGGKSRQGMTKNLSILELTGFGKYRSGVYGSM